MTQIDQIKSKKFIDLTGKKFGRLEVISFVGRVKKQSRWTCKCECGSIIETCIGALKSGKTQHRGCPLWESSGNTRHGMTDSPEHRTWCKIKERCHCPTCPSYKHYGAKGIQVAKEWRDSFESFFSHMGKKPAWAHSIDRIDNSRGYEPGNCRWATRHMQANNKTSNRIVTFRGRTLNLKQWSKALNLPYHALHLRIYRRGWSIEKAFTTPLRIRSV